MCLLFLAGMLMLATMQRVANKMPGPIEESPPQAEHGMVPAPPAPYRPAVAPPIDAGAGDSGHPDASAFGTAAIPPEREAAVLLDFLQIYRREFGAFPTGNENAHFLNALAGANPGGLVIFPLGHPRVSPDGELLDAWGRPFHFHVIDRHHIEVRSHGPDGVLFTEDDLVAPAAQNRGDAGP